MANQLNTLYPPTVPTFAPAFARTVGGTPADAVVYYSISPYNSTDSIHWVHVTVADQKTNSNALVNQNGVFVVRPEIDASTGLYAVTIPNTYVHKDDVDDSDSSLSHFKVNQFYKVQLRFDLNEHITVDGTVYDEQINTQLNTDKLGQYLIDERASFSEWSSVCLVRPILEPDIYLTGFDFDDSVETPGYNKGVIPISGFVQFGDGLSGETETMESYTLKVTGKDSGEVAAQTGNVFTGSSYDPNEISYKLDATGFDTDDETEFVLTITVTTKNQYTFSKDYTFQIVEFVDDEAFAPKLEVSYDQDDGIVSVHVMNEERVKGTLYIKRSSDESDYKVWEDVHVRNVADSIDLTVVDNTVRSMTRYRYSAQLENTKGGFSKTYTSELVFPDFYDCLLSRGRTQLGVRYNYAITSFKPVVNRTKIDTLGGRYPRFAENANMNYRQFSITGTISSQSDAAERFMSRKEAFPNELAYKRYEAYRKENGITDSYDFLYERMFRDSATSWLNDGEPKLYRSQTEGNICVMLTDVSLTPNSTLSRRIWDFSATVYEVEDGDSLATLNYLGIYNPYDEAADGGDGSTHGGTTADSLTPADDSPLTEDVLRISQHYEYEIESANDFISNVVAKELALRNTGVLSGKAVVGGSVSLKNVRLYFQGKPHIYYQQDDGTLLRVTPSVFDDQSYDRSRFVRGFRFVVNDTSYGYSSQNEIFVNENGYYEIPDDIEVTRLSFPDYSNDTVSNTHAYEDGFRTEKVTVDYVLSYTETVSGDTAISAVSLDRTIVGQEYGTFEPDVALSEQILSKYSYVHNNGAASQSGYYRKMTYWKGVSLDVTPYAVFKMLYLDDTEWGTYEVGMTGRLNLLPGHKVKDMCFTGVRMVKKDAARASYLDDWEYVDCGECASFDSATPVNNGVYTSNGVTKIYKNGSWYTFEKDQSIETVGLAKVPVTGAVNYLGDVYYASL